MVVADRCKTSIVCAGLICSARATQPSRPTHHRHTSPHPIYCIIWGPPLSPCWLSRTIAPRVVFLLSPHNFPVLCERFIATRADLSSAPSPTVSPTAATYPRNECFVGNKTTQSCCGTGWSSYGRRRGWGGTKSGICNFTYFYVIFL